MNPDIPIVVAMWIVSALASIIIVLRLVLIHSRNAARTLRSQLSSQEFTLFLAWVFYIVTTVLGTLLLIVSRRAMNRAADAAREQGIPQGYSLLLLTAKEKTSIAQFVYFTYLFNIACLWSTKTTLLAIYLRMREMLPAKIRWFVIANAVYLGGTFVVMFFAHMFSCGPDVTENWNTRNRCNKMGTKLLYISFTMTSVTCDLFLLASSWFTLRHLRRGQHHGRREYFALAFVTATGLLSLSASLIRFGILLKQIKPGNTYNPREIQIWATWTSTETMAAIIACTLPTIRGLLRKIPGREKETQWGRRDVGWNGERRSVPWGRLSRAVRKSEGWGLNGGSSRDGRRERSRDGAVRLSDVDSLKELEMERWSTILNYYSGTASPKGGTRNSSIAVAR